MTDIYDVIEAFVDDEMVDPAALEMALADPAGRAHLIDTMALRSLVRQSSALSIASAKSERRAHRSLLWICAAACLTVAASVGGYLAGTQMVKTDAVISSTVPAPAPAPAPTQVIRFTPGRDWTERAGGN